ncbi:hypothetical protein, partial [Citrobacter freundii]|uniref:hypothetical protein n=1 Tax=Citrobacter freundii TaxID=546 RepID=UPI001BCB809B
FTKCKRLMPGQAKENEKATLIADGARAVIDYRFGANPARQLHQRRPDGWVFLCQNAGYSLTP